MKGPKIESSYFLEGEMGEIEVLEIGTFTSFPISEGAYFVKGNDIVTVKGRDNEMATVKTQGISKFKDSFIKSSFWF